MLSVFRTNDAREPSGNLRALEVELSVVTLVRIVGRLNEFKSLESGADASLNAQLTFVLSD